MIRARRILAFLGAVATLSACGGTVVFEEDGGRGNGDGDGDEVGDNGCPEELGPDGRPEGTCRATVTCMYWSEQCATDWSCSQDKEGEWISFLECIAPANGEWCAEYSGAGDPCKYIGLECSSEEHTVRCSADFVWELVE